MHGNNVSRFAATAVILGALVLGSAARPASADTAIEGGAFVNGKTSGGAALSLGVLNVPLAPVSADITFADAFNGGYAATLDGRLSLAGSAVGAGAGFGSLGATSRTGVIYNALVAHTIFPHTALEARLYFGPSRPSTLFAGLRISL